MKRHQDSLYGTLIRSGAVAGFTLTETAYAPSLQLPRHCHQSAYFCLVLKGNFIEFYERQRRVCRPLTLIFHPRGERHSDHFHTTARCFNLLPGERWAERLPKRSIVTNESAQFGGVLPLLAMKIYREFRQSDEASSLIIEGLMLEILGEASRQSRKCSEGDPPRWLVRTLEVLRDSFTENLSLAEIARSVGVHRTHLAREFRRHYRCTIGEYVRRLRIESACRELSASDTPLAQIAQAAGFFDQSHFGRTFRQFTGMPPALYRKTFRSR